MVRAARGRAQPRRRDQPPLSGVESKAERFLRELPELFEDFPRSEHARERRFAPVAEGVENLAKENNLALRIAEPFLVPGALLIVDDTDWEQVERAMDDYLAEQPRGRVLTLGGKNCGAPQWWDGMQVLEWRP